MAKGAVNPRDVKMQLAHDIVLQLHGPEAARKAEAEFVRVFQKGKLPSDMPIYEEPDEQPIPIIDLLVNTALSSSTSEARRLISQGGVRVNDEKVEDINARIEPRDGTIVRVGKRRFVQIRQS
jgi:tyrosyl-tRNA synthetase